MPAYTECMNDRGAKRKSAPNINGSRTEVFAYAAEQLADIIYEVAKYREIERYDTERIQPFESCGRIILS